MAIAAIRLPLRSNSLTALLIAGTFAAAIVFQPDVARSENFRIETKIFLGDEEEPASETTTLFVDGAVYDFLKSPAQTAVFRKPSGNAAGRFILLNDERRIRTELSTEQLVGAMDKLRTWAGRQSDPFLKFAANPEFEETFASASGTLTLASHLESYTVTTSPAEHPDAIADYHEFLDWYSRLNTLLSGGPPPEPRLRLNEALSRHQVVPRTVELSRAGEEPLRAEHEFTWRLSQADMKRINGVQAALASYRQVGNEEFVHGAQPVK